MLFNKKQISDPLLHQLLSSGTRSGVWLSLSAKSNSLSQDSDYVRELFSIMSLCVSGCISYSKVETKLALISQNYIKKNEVNDVFISLYLCELFLSLKERELFTKNLNELIEIVLSCKTPFSSPLLMNKLIIFFATNKEHLTTSLEARLGSMKSVLVYLISSELALRYPFFQFAGMLIWTRGLECEKKVVNFLESRKKDVDLRKVSSSGLAYVVECEAAIGRVDQSLLDILEESFISEDKFYFTSEHIPYGLYLNTPTSSAICLDTNAHLLLAATNLEASYAKQI